MKSSSPTGIMVTTGAAVLHDAVAVAVTGGSGILSHLSILRWVAYGIYRWYELGKGGAAAFRALESNGAD